MANHTWIRAASAVIFLALGADIRGAEAEKGEPSAPALMAKWRELPSAPILNYQWPPHTNTVGRMRWLDECLRMGITGIYKLDDDPPWGGRLFRDKGLHGLLRQTRLDGPGEPVLGADGQPAPFARRHPWQKSLFSPTNTVRYYDSITAFATTYGPSNLFTVGDTLVMSSWDETGLFTRRQMEYGYTARAEFIRFLRETVYGDEAPDRATNRDGRTFNSTTGSRLTDWQAVPLPRFEARYAQAGLWRLWIDFHGYFTHLFMRRGGLAASRALGRDLELFTFSHATAKWPGGASARGLDLYWQARLNRVLTVEDCQSDYPGSTVHYAFTDQLSRRYGLPVLGWSWFSDSNESWRSREPLDAARALARAMGHTTHGLIFYLYRDYIWRLRPVMRRSVAYWHHVYLAHWPFLRNATTPAPTVAVVYPRNAGNMYALFEYPKNDFGWTCQALSEAHVPFEVIADNQVEREPGILADYQVLLLPSATWESPLFRAAVERFVAGGGFVYADGDGFMMDTETGKPTDFLARVFGVQPLKKYKGVFWPTYDSEAEYAWLHDPKHKVPDVEWEGAKNRSRFRARGEWVLPASLDSARFDAMQRALPAASGAGLPQTLLDPRVRQDIVPVESTPHLAGYRTYHDVVTGTPSRSNAVPIATFKDEICAVATERTVWTGFRPGFDHACLFPVYDMRVYGEPIWPFEINQATSAEQRRGPREWILRVVRQAGIQPLVEVRHAGISASHIEVLVRRDREGNALVWLINHEGIGGVHLMESAWLSQAGQACELRSGSPLTPDKDGLFAVDIPALDVAIVAVGTESFVAERLRAQRAVPGTIEDMPASF